MLDLLIGCYVSHVTHESHQKTSKNKLANNVTPIRKNEVYVFFSEIL